jgi:16S rRNA (cytidine1402-2'-O)-methyltransferase
MNPNKVEGQLFIISVPIGNLKDITERAKETLQTVDLIACEDTRVTGKLLKALAIQRGIPLISYRDENEHALSETLLAKIKDGVSIALLSDAGTPAISDPGFRLINACRIAGVTITALPGACALINALALSGLPTDSFLFAGFLAPKRSARQKFFREHADQPYTIILYESCHRIEKCIEDIITVLGSDRVISICREMTKIHESVHTGNALEVQETVSRKSKKGEFVVLIAKKSFRN